MPGYKLTPVEPLKTGLKCLECDLLLRDPVQTDDGDRLCRTCYEAIKTTGISKGGIKLGTGEDAGCYPDRAVGKEIKQLFVKCYNHDGGCPWQGKLEDLEKYHNEECDFKPQQCPNDGCKEIIAKTELKNHIMNVCLFRIMTCKFCGKNIVAHHLEAHYEEECLEYPVRCERCSESVKKYLLEEHHDRDCPYVECLCHELVRRIDLEAHYSLPGALFKHLEPLQILHRAVLKSQKHLREKFEEKIKLSQDTSTTSGEIHRVESELQTYRSQLDSRLILLEQKLEALKPLESDVASSRRDYSKLRESTRSIQEKIDSQEDRLRQVQGQVVAAKGRGGVAVSGSGGRYPESYIADTRIIVMERKLEDLERQNSMLKVHVSELELQLQASLASTHNGSFLWRIPDVERRRKDAQEERITSIYSPPFYTGRNGYKMCIRAYLNGDGIGFKTHLSLFFVLMRGEYDPLLKWPFEHKVSLILVDQEHRKHIVQTFKPTPESSSFKRPTSDMNVASGCPQFSTVDVLQQNNYIKEDIMYIKCIVDVSRIFHP